MCEMIILFFKTLQIIVLPISTIGAIVIAWYYFSQIVKNVKNRNVERAKYYTDFFVPQYADGKFDKLNKNDSTGYFIFKPGTVSFKDFRNKIVQHFGRNFYVNEVKNDKFKNEILNTESVLNAGCYRIGITLNRIGALGVNDVFDLRMIMNLHAPQIIEDWVYGYYLVVDKISKNKYGYNLPDSRKYFFWLTCVAVLFLNKKFKHSKEKFDDIISNIIGISGKYKSDFIKECMEFNKQVMNENSVNKFSDNGKFLNGLNKI